jgi:hypothetical protein
MFFGIKQFGIINSSTGDLVLWCLAGSFSAKPELPEPGYLAPWHSKASIKHSKSQNSASDLQTISSRLLLSPIPQDMTPP